MPDLWLTGDHFMDSVLCGSAHHQANSAVHPSGGGEDHQTSDHGCVWLFCLVAGQSPWAGRLTDWGLPAPSAQIGYIVCCS